MADLWEQALQGLKPRIGERTFDLWIRPIALDEVEGDRLRLTAPSRFMKDWFETHYLTPILDELQAQTERRFEVDLRVAEGEVAALEPQPVEYAETTAPATAGGTQTTPSNSGQRRAPRPAPQHPVPIGLRARYTFDAYVEGPSNELAASAAWAVAEEPGARFNPLFIYGGVGLGKTHLLHAIGHRIHEHHPRQRIVYLSAEKFMNEFIGAVRANEFDEFRRRYRDDCDVLLIDDIQCIAGRDRTMDEFFHVFNALYESGKQIVVAADRTPGEMEGMEERLTSRLNWGLVADIRSPDLETRVAILRRRADRDGIAMSEEASLHLATRVRSNVRELEGALTRVATFASLRNVAIDRSFIDEVLGHATPVAEVPHVTVEAIQKAVAQQFALRIADLKGPRRNRGISRPRMIAMYLARRLTGASFPEIGLRFGGKDHSTVIYACDRIDNLCGKDPKLRDVVDQLQRRVLGEP